MMNNLVSIVILTKNAGYDFEKTIDAIYKQRIDNGYEIIVVDSGSKDETLNILRKYGVKLYQISPNDFNFGLTRNYAFSLAKGDIIVTISQDVVPCNSLWLYNIIKPFYNNNNIVAVQGGTRIPEHSDVFYWEKIGYFYFTSESVNWIKKHKCGLSFVNCAVRRDFWVNNQIGFTLYSEDKVFQKMIYESGNEVYIAEDSVCYHGHQYSIFSLIKRLINEGVGWKNVEVSYRLLDCLHDLYKNKWLIRKSFGAYTNKEINTIQELFFPLLRPICIYIGNKKNLRKL